MKEVECTSSQKGRTSAPWTPGHAQTSLTSSLISPHSCNILHLLLLDHSLLSTPDALGQIPMALQQKKNIYFMPYACLDGLSQGSTSYDLHLDMVHVQCNQAEGRKVSCNAKTVSVYRKHWEIYLYMADRQKNVCLGLASKWRQNPSEKYQITRLLSALMHTLASCYLSYLLKAFEARAFEILPLHFSLPSWLHWPSSSSTEFRYNRLWYQSLNALKTLVSIWGYPSCN